MASPNPFLQHALKRGLKGFRRPGPLSLYQDLEIPGKRPTTVVRLLQAIIAHECPLLSPEEQDAMALARLQDDEDEGDNVDPLLLQSFNLIADELADEQLQKQIADMKEAHEKRHAKTVARTAMEQHLQKSAPDPVPAESSGFAASSSGNGAAHGVATAAALKKIHWPPPPAGFPQKSAKVCLPPGCLIRKDTSRAQRWQVSKGDFLTFDHSRSWNPGNGLDVNEALCVVLLLAWRDYARSPGGSPCPWALDLAPLFVAQEQ